eukprot:TRINITY_DN1213_c0_g2_i3.p1 TRINITY_DN1213_c0_g2~~TRINITY_DN1213_c0_g2_i3.p1  ORF type:complete len:1111 (+),score=439.87 TRINITY_DN1213_c0_g2_i3:84-3416(+)
MHSKEPDLIFRNTLTEAQPPASRLVFGASSPLNVSDIIQSASQAYCEQRRKVQSQTFEEYRKRYEDGQFQLADLREYMKKQRKKEGNAFIRLITQPCDELKPTDPKIKELETLLKRDDIPPNIKGNLELQLKALKLQPLQQKLKKVLFKNEEVPSGNLLENFLVDRQFYTRARLIPLADRKGTKTLERYELQMRTGQEQRRRGRHKEFLQELLSHAREFLEYHKKKCQILKKRAGQAKAHIESIGKKEQHDKDKSERERIKMIKANDIKRYRETVDKAKNSRLIEILDQTERYLEQLGAKVVQQKKETALLTKLKQDGEGSRGMPLVANAAKAEAEEADGVEEDNKTKIDFFDGGDEYYKITHTIKEEVLEDPKTLKGGKLKSYQLQGLQWLVSLYNNNLNGILADEMGLGKTIQTLALFCYLMETKNNDGPFLVVVPLSTLTNWDMEIDRWCAKIKKLIYKGDPATRKHLANLMHYEKFNVILTTYEYIIKDKNLLSRISWQYIVVDEGHRMKNYKCKFAMILGQQYQSAHRLLLTGTPLQNNLSELWALLNFLLPKIFSSCEDFEKWFNRPFAKFGMEKNVLLDEEERLLIVNRLHQVLRPFLLRRMKKEVERELPNKIEYVIKVDLSAWQKIYYEQLKKRGMLALDPSTGKIGSKSLMNTLMQLRKICNHPYLFLSSYDTDFLIGNIWRCSGKFELLDRIIPKLIVTGHKILIFSQMTQLMNIMQMYFNIKGLEHLRLDGTTKADDRGQWTHLFNSEDSEYKIFLLSTRAGGLGLNLQAADTVIIFDSDFNPQMDLQAQDRAHRIGQKHEVRVYRLITNTEVEEDILSRATKKKNLDNVVIQAGLFNQKASDVDRRKKLEDLLRQDDKSADEEDDAVPDDEQINEMLARSGEEFQLYQNLDVERYVNEGREEKSKEMMERLGLAALPKNFNYRLMQEYEVPEWVTNMPTEEKKETILGKRVRKKINYSDDITEKQWEKCIEEGKDPSEEVERLRNERELRKKKKIEKDVLDEALNLEENNTSSNVMKIRIPPIAEEGFGKANSSVDFNEDESEGMAESGMIRVSLNLKLGNGPKSDNSESGQGDPMESMSEGFDSEYESLQDYHKSK